MRARLIDIKFVALTMTGMTLFTWYIIAPFVAEIREHFGTRRWVSEWEYLVIELNRFIEEKSELQTLDREDTVFSLRNRP